MPPAQGCGTWEAALEEFVALVKAMESHPADLQGGLCQYEKPIVEKIVMAATASARRYFAFEEHMKLRSIEFGYGYITRSGRVSNDRLRHNAPKLMARYDEHVARQTMGFFAWVSEKTRMQRCI